MFSSLLASSDILTAHDSKLESTNLLENTESHLDEDEQQRGPEKMLEDISIVFC